MLDIKLIRDNPDFVRTGLQNRGGRAIPDFEKALAKDKEWRTVLGGLESCRTEQNTISAEIAKSFKKKPAGESAGEAGAPIDMESLRQKSQELKTKIKDFEELERRLKEETEAILLTLPNIPDASVPVGKSAEDNKVVREVGTKRTINFKAKDHHEVGTSLGILDFETATKLSGARFAMYVGAGARLERSIANFMLDLHTKEFGYTEVIPPFLVSRKTMTNTGQLPKFEEDLFKSNNDLFLIPTSEVPLTNINAEKTIEEKDLPRGVTALTPCFRSEAGSYGKDTKGLTRNHQFDKVELVRFCKMEDSLKEHEKLTLHAEEVLKRLELPYRVLLLCTGDMGFSSAKTYDLEVWMPGENVWREISSCSTCTDFQSRRMNFKVAKDKKREWGCTLNGSGLAVGRTLAAILENGQQADGSVLIPKALHSYFGGDKITKPS